MNCQKPFHTEHVCSLNLHHNLNLGTSMHKDMGLVWVDWLGALFFGNDFINAFRQIGKRQYIIKVHALSLCLMAVEQQHYFIDCLIDGSACAPRIGGGPSMGSTGGYPLGGCAAARPRSMARTVAAPQAFSGSAGARSRSMPQAQAHGLHHHSSISLLGTTFR